MFQLLFATFCASIICIFSNFSLSITISVGFSVFLIYLLFFYQMDPPYTIDTPTTVQLTQTRQPNLGDVTNIITSSNLGDAFYTTSPSSHFPLVPSSQHTTPNTPTSIPDIILTGKKILVLH